MRAAAGHGLRKLLAGSRSCTRCTARLSRRSTTMPRQMRSGQDVESKTRGADLLTTAVAQNRNNMLLRMSPAQRTERPAIAASLKAPIDPTLASKDCFTDIRALSYSPCRTVSRAAAKKVQSVEKTQLGGVWLGHRGSGPHETQPSFRRVVADTAVRTEKSEARCPALGLQS